MAELSRRQVIVIGAVGAGAIVAGAGVWAVGQLAPPVPGDAAGSPGGKNPPAVTWSEPSVVEASQGVLELDLVVAAAPVTVAGETVTMLTYNGTVPGPTLHLRPGDKLIVHLTNKLDQATNLHTHGLLVSADGNSDNPFIHVEPGETFDYEIDLPADHPPGVYWYHPHHHGHVADQVFGGLYGAIVVDTDDWSTGAPRVVVVSDVTINGGAVASATQQQRMMGRTGELLLANGAVNPVLAAPPGSTQRLLIVNACVGRYLDLSLSGLQARLGAIDIGSAGDESIDHVVLAPGNRADLTMVMPQNRTEVAALAYDRGSMGMGMMGGGQVTSPGATMLTLSPDPAAPASTPPPIAANVFRDRRQMTPDRSRRLTLAMGMGGGGMSFTIDGREFDPDRTDHTVQINTLEEWVIANTSAMSHPFHLHVWPMQVVAIGDTPVDRVDVRDVVDVPPQSSVTVRILFDRFPGRTVYHCHLFDHEDLGMMGVVAATD